MPCLYCTFKQQMELWREDLKYFLSFIVVIFLLFAGLLFYGRSLPQTFIFEQSIKITADADLVYDELVGSENIRVWAPYLAGLGLDNTALTGAEHGAGQVISWRRARVPFETGVQEVLAVTPPYFVQSRFSSAPYEGSVIYAASQSLPSEDMTVLVRLDLDAGDFPYFDRIKLNRHMSAINEELFQSLTRLKTVVERQR